MSTITSDILEELQDDLISHGWLVQAVTLADDGTRPLQTRLGNVLSELLATAKVELGVTEQATPDYLEFVAWRGTVEERVNRALEAVDNASALDKDFAYWLCLRENVDHFEDEESTKSKQEE